MNSDDWRGVLARISGSKPVDLDPLLFADCDGTTGIPVESPATSDLTRLSKKLFTKKDTTLSYIGIKVTQAGSDHTKTAIRLAAAALEKGVVPIILTTLNESGFERFGFRVERLAGKTEQELSLQQEQLVAFWDIAIVVNVADATLLN